MNHSVQQRFILLISGLAGLSAVVLAAAGGHMIPSLADPENARSWQTANNIHFFHAIVLMVLSQFTRQTGGRLILWSAVSITVGILLFSGSIYLSKIVPGTELGKLAPVGGFALMLGWSLVIVHALRKRFE